MSPLSVRPRNRVQLSPPIYLLHVDRGRLSPATWDGVGLVIELSEGTVYLSIRNGYIFGYPALINDESLCRAVVLRRKFAAIMGKDRVVSLSASGRSHREYADILDEPWKHLGSVRLGEALRRRVAFERIEPEGTRFLPHERIERLKRALEQIWSKPARRH